MEDELKEFGLSRNEIGVYLALLKIGSTTANRISAITGIKRSTGYDTLKLLVSKGIVVSHIQDGKMHYECAPPRKLLEVLREKQDRIADILPSLERLRSVIPKRSSVSLYEGRRGAVNLITDVFDTGKDFFFYGSRKSAEAVFLHYPKMVKRRAQLGLRHKGVHAEDDRNDPVYFDPGVKKLSKMRFLKDLNGVEANVFMYGTKVGILSSGEDLVGVIIESPSILKQQKRIFEILWKHAKK